MNYFQRLSHTPARPRGFLQKVALALATAGVFVVALMFSVVLFAAALTVGAVVAGYLWWRMRKVRARMREQMQARQQQYGARPADGDVLEGVVIREVDTHDERHPHP